MGRSPLNNKQVLDLNTGAFTFEANIVELYKKESMPDGQLSDGAVGQVASEESECITFKAILDFGELDVDPGSLIPEDPNVKFFGNSSDLTVYDLGDNPHHYATGDVIRFRPKYMAVARLMHSRFVEKALV